MSNVRSKRAQRERFVRWAIPVASGLLAFAFAPQGEAVAGNGQCKPAFGVFMSNAVPPPACQSNVGICTLGHLFGSLGGSYEFTMNQLMPSGEAAVPFVNFFSGSSKITTKQGDILEGVDTGSLNGLPPGEQNSGKFSTMITITEGGSGHLFVRGTLDLATGSAAGVYTGRVCID
jgi:hypothetical protein